MQSAEIIHQAIISGRKSLSEAESKLILKTYGVPVVEEKIVYTAKQAANHAAAIGYPVVLKGLGAKLTHKTERGLVKLNLKNHRDINEAGRFF